MKRTEEQTLRGRASAKVKMGMAKILSPEKRECVNFGNKINFAAASHDFPGKIPLHTKRLPN